MAQIMNLSESVAKCFFEAAYPGSRMDHNTVQSHGEHDFNLHFSDGTIAALEVTACVNATEASTIAAIKKGSGGTVPATKCKQSWVVFVASGASIKTVRSNIDEYLSRLESAGVSRFYLYDVRHPFVQDLVRDLGVISAGVISNGSAPTIKITLSARGGAVGAISAVEVGENEAQKADNRRKLAAAGTEERVLAVYIDPQSGGPWLALTEFRPPSTSANLPLEVTSLWLIAPTGKLDDEFVGWHGCANQPWQGCTIVCN